MSSFDLVLYTSHRLSSALSLQSLETSSTVNSGLRIDHDFALWLMKKAMNYIIAFFLTFYLLPLNKFNHLVIR